MHRRSKNRFEFEKVNLGDKLERRVGETQGRRPIRRILQQFEKK